MLYLQAALKLPIYGNTTKIVHMMRCNTSYSITPMYTTLFFHWTTFYYQPVIKMYYTPDSVNNNREIQSRISKIPNHNKINGTFNPMIDVTSNHKYNKIITKTSVDIFIVQLKWSEIEDFSYDQTFFTKHQCYSLPHNKAQINMKQDQPIHLMIPTEHYNQVFIYLNRKICKKK